MKKLIALLLILIMILPAASLAEDRDPIVGCWYMYYEKESFPELAETYNNNDYIIMVLIFTGDGTILTNETDIKDKAGTPVTYSAGKWQKNGSSYKFSIIGIGQGLIEIENDCILLQPSEYQNIFMKFRKLVPFDPYSDYIFR